MIKVGLLLLFVFSISSCATSPKGTSELMDKLETDRERQDRKSVNIQQGRPVFIEIAAYPRILPSGDIWTGGAILLNMGREDLNIGNMLKKYREKEDE